LQQNKHKGGEILKKSLVAVLFVVFSVAFAFFSKVAYAVDDVWTTATTAITTAGTNVTAILLLLIGIVASIFGYRIVRKMLRGTP
jgi:NADH:ubiquinone oxidoreductase subunit 3 (subunit A)